MLPDRVDSAIIADLKRLADEGNCDVNAVIRQALDALIEKKYHKAVSQIFAEMGEDKFREIERECLHEVADFEKPSFRPVVERPAFSITWII